MFLLLLLTKLPFDSSFLWISKIQRVNSSSWSIHSSVRHFRTFREAFFCSETMFLQSRKTNRVWIKVVVRYTNFAISGFQSRIFFWKNLCALLRSELLCNCALTKFEMDDVDSNKELTWFRRWLPNWDRQRIIIVLRCCETKVRRYFKLSNKIFMNLEKSIC